ncbi:hypothetical protein b3_0084 [Synechococcus phage B3]|nr:hypothetical protein b3_0084 [Synechococcus phage B3]QGT54698.1 hypothetical protein b23_0083 [Synechococcus phage B23]
MELKDGAYKCFTAFYQNRPVAINFTYSGIKSDIYRLIIEEKCGADVLDYRIKEYLIISRDDLSANGYSKMREPEFNWDYLK